MFLISPLMGVSFAARGKLACKSKAEGRVARIGHLEPLSAKLFPATIWHIKESRCIHGAILLQCLKGDELIREW